MTLSAHDMPVGQRSGGAAAPAQGARATRTSRFSLGLGIALLTALITTTMGLGMQSKPARATFEGLSLRKAQTAKLDNGMEVVVITDARAPVVTHMVWYRVGAADEAPGKSGIAHFLEHLMFKGTDTIAPGEFSKIVAREGGQDNAFTGQDVTAYFQRVAKDRLPLMMKIEADRMANLRLLEADVLTERDVIIEERNSRVENRPGSLLAEEMSAMLYRAHPYGTPIIGWEREIETLDREDALAFYERYYAPNNAILVVSGDVTLDEVVALAKETYGKHSPSEGVARGPRPSEPPHRAPRRITLEDERVGQPVFQRYYSAPSYSRAEPGKAEAMDLLMHAVGGSSTSRAYQSLVVEQGLASNASGYYSGSALDYGSVAISAVPANGVALETLEAAYDAVLADVAENGITQAELDRARTQFLAAYIYSNDNQSTLARRYGWGLATGSTIEEIEAWPQELQKVTLDDVNAAARTLFDPAKSVTGYLLPKAAANDNEPGDDRASRSRPTSNAG